MSIVISYKDWHIPYLQGSITLRQARDSMASVRARQNEIPLMVQLVENPKYHLPGLRLFYGAVDLAQHDFIHIVLGRGLLDKDEAFTIGFTMGATHKVSTTEEVLYALIARYLYPKVYQFGEEAVEVFKNAVRLAYICGCRSLDNFDFTSCLDATLNTVREEVGLQTDLLLAYYKIESQRYPLDPASQRLLVRSSKLPGF